MTHVDPFRLSAHELLALATAAGLPGKPHQERGELLAQLLQHQLDQGQTVLVDGVFERLPEGFGFLRSPHHDLVEMPADAFVSPSQVRALNLKPGHRLRGPIRAPKGNERFFALLHVDTCNGAPPERLADRVDFHALVPLVPSRALALGDRTPLQRALAAAAPWRHGHRVLIEAPAGTSPTPLLATLANAVHGADPQATVVLLLLAERPEVLAAARARCAAQPAIPIVATTFDATPNRHVQTAQLALAMAQRATEAGERVVLLVGGLDALVRACQLDQPPSGRWLCAGLDAHALQLPRQLFAAARATAGGGSLSVLGTVAPEVGHVVDDTIAAAFRSFANSVVVLDAERLRSDHAVPIDVSRCRTRPEDDPRHPAERDAALRAAIG